jgi:hypothetical protein
MPSWTRRARKSIVGLYVFGSLATGNFEPDISDIDLIAALTVVPDERLATRLRDMHEDFALSEPAWDDRIEVNYVSLDGLANCRTASTTIARISPGEPLHLIEAGRDFLLDWYPARRDGVALVGPPIVALIPKIPEAEYVEEVRRYVAVLGSLIDDDAPSGTRSYAVLSMCRGFYAIRTGERLSKREAAARARDEFPQWEALIDEALVWRGHRRVDQPVASGSLSETQAFLQDIGHRLSRD